MALLSMSITPNVIRVIAEGEWAPRAFASIPRTPALCLALGVHFGGGPPGTAVGCTLGIFAEYRRKKRQRYRHRLSARGPR